MSAATMTEHPAPARPSRFTLARLIPLGRSLLINILAPTLAYRLATPWFAPDSPAPLLISAAIPAADFAVVYFRRRTIDAIAVISFTQLLVSILINVASRSASLALSAHALQAGGMGLVFAASAAIRRPLIRPLARQTIAGDDPARQAKFDSRAQLPEVQRTFTRMTLFWACALCAESTLRLIALHHLKPADYLLLSAFLSYGFTTALIWASVRYGRYRASKLAGQ